jgi:hypothetical protein
LWLLHLHLLLLLLLWRRGLHARYKRRPRHGRRNHRALLAGPWGALAYTLTLTWALLLEGRTRGPSRVWRLTLKLLRRLLQLLALILGLLLRLRLR